MYSHEADNLTLSMVYYDTLKSINIERHKEVGSTPILDALVELLFTYAFTPHSTSTGTEQQHNSNNKLQQG